MNKHKSKGFTVLSIFPTTRSFGFVIFESPQSPLDWGIRETTRKTLGDALESARKLMQRHHPDVLVIEDLTETGVRRGIPVRRFYRGAVHVAESLGITVERVTRTDIKRAYAHVGAKNKYEIAVATATEIEAFRSLLPAKRKEWVTEDRRMALFDASSRGLAFYAKEATSKS
jgi:hypothetical protein